MAELLAPPAPAAPALAVRYFHRTTIFAAVRAVRRRVGGQANTKAELLRGGSGEAGERAFTTAEGELLRGGEWVGATLSAPPVASV